MATRYRRLALEFHPDRNSSGDAETRFTQIAEAYSVLSDGTELDTLVAHLVTR